MGIVNLKKKYKVNKGNSKEGVNMLAVKKSVIAKDLNKKFSPASTEEVLTAIKNSNKKHSKMMSMLSK